MVYSRIEIMIGIVLTSEEAERFFRLEEGEVDDILGQAQVTLRNQKSIALHDITHLHGQRAELYLLGYSLRTYYRKLTALQPRDSGCERCTELSYCQTCIGSTNNGFYDVERMQSEAVPVDLQHICFHCYSDNRLDMGYPANENQNALSQRTCSTCGRPPFVGHTAQRNLEEDYHYKQFLPALKKLARKMDYKEPLPKIGLYYCLDDCICCT